MTSKIKVNNIEDTSGNAMVSKCGSTITLGKSGDTVAIASGASTTGMGRSGAVNWQTTTKTSTFTAADGEGYFCDTSSGAFTANLPAGSAGNIVAFKDYANSWDSNALTVTPNGSQKVNGNTGSAVLNTEDQSVTIIYVDDTKGWRVVNDSTSSVDAASFVTATGGNTVANSPCGNFKIHTFTAPGNFVVSCAGNSAGNNKVDYVVVAGGGSGGCGGTGDTGGGGGAGGYRESHCSSVSGPYTASPLATPASITVTAQSYPIVVGAGGAGSQPKQGAAGSVSSALGISSAGGGGGAANATGPGYCSPANGDGGSGGGGRGGGGIPGAGGNGNTPPVSPPQGNNGGSGAVGNSPDAQAGGGGGATAVGGNATSSVGGPGGAGAVSSITATPVARAGGGGGGAGPPTPNGNRAPGGNGGGGQGGAGGGGCASAGTANTGGGGGGASPATNSAAAGGSGIVIIRYKFQ